MSEEIIHSFGIELWHAYVIIGVIGVLQGFINTMAGSGTVLMFSILSSFGMPVNMINGTVRLGVLFQTFTASARFYKNDKSILKKGLILAIPIIVGSVFGALTATNIDKNVFEKIVGVILLFLMFLMFYNSKKWLEGQSIEKQSKTGIWQFILFTLIGFYGGFIHIGIGIFLLSALVLNGGFDLVKANSLKVFLVFVSTPIALIIFFFNGQVDLYVALAATIGNIIGGYIGAGMAIKHGTKFIKIFLAIIITIFSMHLLGILEFLYNLFT